MEGDMELLMSHPVFADRLIKYLSYRLKSHLSSERITTIVGEVRAGRMNTSDAIMLMRTESKTTKQDDNFDAARANSRVRDITKFKTVLPQKVTKYLDIGTADGVIAAGIGKMVGLSKADIIGADIEGWADRKLMMSPDITFRAMDDPAKLPMKTATADVVTVLMTLHHIPPLTLSKILIEIKRVLAPGGIVIVREHDCPNKYTRALINIEHAIFQVVVERASDIAKFQTNYYGGYLPKYKWAALFRKHDFEIVGEPMTFSKADTRPYYHILK
jgi:SAM-dependent methyltransferase